MGQQQPQVQLQQQLQQPQIAGRPPFQQTGPPGYPTRGQTARWPMAPPVPLAQQRTFMAPQTGPGPGQGSALIAQLTQPPTTQFPQRLDGKLPDDLSNDFIKMKRNVHFRACDGSADDPAATAAAEPANENANNDDRSTRKSDGPRRFGRCSHCVSRCNGSKYGTAKHFSATGNDGTGIGVTDFVLPIPFVLLHENWQ